MGTTDGSQWYFFAQKWIAFFDFGSAPTFAHYTGAAAGTCGATPLVVMGIRYK